ncbi:MAG: UDP-N-acetylmuramoyl-tripeptide--D-alanyl-D-alanine ligase [Candidatus Pelethousia sp.]|nr:UDP-N-acetylmuramoyl-tripeptide--D-alanyl-D-alanine ligase [Candidatus Pelethousia sp.]
METTEILIQLSFWTYVLVDGAAVALAAIPFVHMLQLESYQGHMYLKWVGKHPGQCMGVLLAGAAGLLLRVAGSFLGGPMGSWIWRGGDVLYTALLVAYGFSARKRQKNAKKPLAYTARVKRLFVPLFLLALAGPALRLLLQSMYRSQLLMGIQPWGGWADYAFWPEIVRFLPGMALPLTVFFAYLITWPLEKLVQGWYLNDARKRLLKNPYLIRVGITGSFGKTSTKYALGTLLSEQYNTLFTPGSFNTPMGVTRVIREKLTDAHQVFIAEMGARYCGDIAELCRLVKPQYGIITAVGKQHLETFGSLEKVIRTKAELLAGLPDDGACFLNGDDPVCREIYNKSQFNKKFLFGTEGDGLYMRAENISVGPAGSHFELAAADGARIACATKLLGRHNILNVAGAAALAHWLGLTEEQIAAGVAKLTPVEHRLQLLEGPVTIIDDAFNANPVGAGEALEVLKSFPGRRIIITPGMVELGEEQETLNRAFGAHMAACADIAILVGPNGPAMEDGLLSASFNQSCLIRVETLAQAMEKLPLYQEPGCTVLFENDLTDNFN